MPSCITHELIAQSARALLPARLRQAVDAAPDYYYLGSQGPDLYFFYKPFSRRKNNLGKVLHREGVYRFSEALLSVLASRKGKEYDRCLAYALGFCSHLEGDAAFHPFVYTYLDETGAKNSVHQRIENDWDVYFLATIRSRSVFHYPFPYDLKRIAHDGVLYAYVRDAAGMLGRRISAGAFGRAVRLYRRYLIHFHKQRGRFLLPFLPAMYPRETWDPAILEGEDFSRLSGKRARDADELFLLAARESAERMCEFASCVESGASLPASFSRHLHTGEIQNAAKD